MFISRSRQKLLNAIAYFTANTLYCNTLKLFKLLNFLDFEHYRQTGRSVTGLTYEAWKKGPVPRSLWKEVQAPPADLSAFVKITEHRKAEDDELQRRDFKPTHDFDRKLFTRRELAIMERLALFFKELKAEQMSGFSHGKKMPWQKFYKGEGERPAVIPYDAALESPKIIDDMPTIDRDELEYRREALKEIESNTG